MFGSVRQLFNKVTGFRLDEELSRAVINGDISSISTLVRLGADVNSPKCDPLGAAIICNQIDAARALIKLKADVNGRNEPLRAAVFHDRPEIVELLLAAGASKDRGEPIRTAIAHGHTECVRILIASGVRIGPLTDNLIPDLEDRGYHETARLVVEAATREEAAGLDRDSPRESLYHLMFYPPNSLKEKSKELGWRR